MDGVFSAQSINSFVYWWMGYFLHSLLDSFVHWCMVCFLHSLLVLFTDGWCVFCTVVSSVQDVCNAEGGTLCGNQYTCVNNTCFFKCEFFSCYDHGECYLEVFSGVSETKCRFVFLYTLVGRLCICQVYVRRRVLTLTTSVCATGLGQTMFTDAHVCVFFRCRSDDVY